MTDRVLGPPSARTEGWLKRLVESRGFQRIIIAAILVNGVILGLETSQTVMARIGPWLILADHLILGLFVLELLAKLLVYRLDFFRSGWNMFDLLVVGISLVPAAAGLSVLRALRILRVLRLFSVVPEMRRVVGALFGALPGLGSIVAVLVLVFYVSAVLATKLFGADFPDWFGTIGASMYSLFQIMTLESWSMGIVRPVMEVHPWAWLFFVPFILVTSFTVLNLFIAIIVNSMQKMHEAELQEVQAADRQAIHEETQNIAEQIAALRRDVSELRSLLMRRDASASEQRP